MSEQKPVVRVNLYYCPHCAYPVDAHYFELCNDDTLCQCCKKRLIKEFAVKIIPMAKVIHLRAGEDA